MGWVTVVGYYYSFVLVGVAIGALYPFYCVFARAEKLPSNIKQPVSFILYIFATSMKCGFYTFLLLTILAFAGSIIFSIWAITKDAVT